MIIFGSRGKTIAGPDRQGGPVCGYCGKDRHATYGTIQYVHVFFIPVFPFSRQPVMQCLHCRKMLVGDEIDQPARGEIARQVFTPLQTATTFIGTILVALWVLLVFVQDCGSASKRADYLRNPAAGDYYVVRASAFGTAPEAKIGYAIMQVAAISGQKVQLHLGQARYADTTRARSALRAGETELSGYFDPAPIELPVDELQSLRSKGSIAAIERR